MHRYLAEFKKLCALAAPMRKPPRELGYEDYLRLRGRVEAMVIKLYLKFLHEVTCDEKYEKLYACVRVPSLKQALPEELTRGQVEIMPIAVRKITVKGRQPVVSLPRELVNRYNLEGKRILLPLDEHGHLILNLYRLCRTYRTYPRPPGRPLPGVCVAKGAVVGAFELARRVSAGRLSSPCT